MYKFSLRGHEEETPRGTRLIIRVTQDYKSFPFITVWCEVKEFNHANRKSIIV